MENRKLLKVNCLLSILLLFGCNQENIVEEHHSDEKINISGSRTSIEFGSDNYNYWRVVHDSLTENLLLVKSTNGYDMVRLFDSENILNRIDWYTEHKTYAHAYFTGTGDYSYAYGFETSFQFEDWMLNQSKLLKNIEKENFILIIISNHYLPILSVIPKHDGLLEYDYDVPNNLVRVKIKKETKNAPLTLGVILDSGLKFSEVPIGIN